jgi:hypothetical protein
MWSRYAGGHRLCIGAEAILAAEHNSFADRIKKQRPAADTLWYGKRAGDRAHSMPLPKIAI